MPHLRIKNKALVWGLAGISALLYFYLAYFVVRQDFFLVLSLYAALFLAFALILKSELMSFKMLSWMALVLRLVFIAALPNLSNDFYRFIWDGRMLIEGLNPYLYNPELFLQGPMSDLIHEGQVLYEGMGSLNGHHYTCYPPVNQIGFFIPALFFSENILGSTILMRLFIMLADVGVWWIGPKLLKLLNINAKAIFLYLLNPFIIIELTGNLHFEGVMLFFLIWAIYLLLVKSWKWSAIVMALSICVKLIPLIFLPILLRKMAFKKALIYYVICLGVVTILFAPFISVEFLENFMSSINLYFQSFEFNASIYYIIRAIGYESVGYNIIHQVGKVLPIIIVLGILLISWLRKNGNPKVYMTSLMWIIFFYLLLSTTVHPWYIAVILMLSIFTNFKFPLIWSFFIIFSYSAYRSEEYQENLIFVGLEYGLVLGFLIFEIFKNRNNSKALGKGPSSAINAH